MTISVISWESPEPALAGRGRRKATLRTGLERLAEELRERPGEWAKVAENSTHNIGTRLKDVHGMEVAFRSAGRDYESGHSDIYARYPLIGA